MFVMILLLGLSPQDDGKTCAAGPFEGLNLSRLDTEWRHYVRKLGKRR